MPKYTESTLEQATLEWLAELGYGVAYGPEISPDLPAGSTQADSLSSVAQETMPLAEKERADYGEVILAGRLREAVARINPEAGEEARKEAIRKVLQVPNTSPNLAVCNQTFHQMLRDGVNVEYQAEDGSPRGDQIRLVDLENLDNNDWLAVNQFTVIENKNRRPDVVIFVNGLPIAVFELKNPADEKATVKKAYHQIQTYLADIPSLFAYNELCVISDSFHTKMGTITSSFDWFMKWRTVDGEVVAPLSQNELKVLVNGVFQKKVLLDLVTNFIAFEKDKEQLVKKVALYHQYHATNKAIQSTVKATKDDGDGRIGVIWHTQGAGKSLTMAFYTGKIIQKLNNPTIVVLTDRNDLDQQLFNTFSGVAPLFRQTPKQIERRANLKRELKVASGGVIFTTIQKFLPEEVKSEFPLLSERKNIVVIADEAHRSHYGFKAKLNRRQSLSYGFAKYVRDAFPNAAFIGFTGTPIALRDKNTISVFGEVIDTYDVTRAVEDQATVPIYYEARLAKINLAESEKPKIDAEFEEVTEGEEVECKERLKSKWSRLEAMVGAEKRLGLIAEDIIEHFEERQSVISGKGIIVCMSRRIAVEMYKNIITARPKWHSEDDQEGSVKVIMSGSASDPAEFQPHLRNKQALDELALGFKDDRDRFQLAIVRDMWLTGFDVPCLHTMYIDKPMRGHGLMQTIARVNRKYKDKQAGLIVDYLGVANELRDALSYYSEGDQQNTAVPQDEAVKILLEKYEIVKEMFHGFAYPDYFSSLEARRTEILTEAVDFVLSLEDGAERYKKAVTELVYAFSIAIPHQDALTIRDEVAFFQAVKAGLVKLTPTGGGPTEEDYDQAIKQIVSKAVVPEKVIDIFAEVGLKKPNIDILSDEFLAEVAGLEQKNIAFEVLKKLINGEIKSLERRYLVKARSFREMLEETLTKYQNRTIESAQVIAELIELAKSIRQEQERGGNLGLSEDEIAFYDALANNESAVRELGDETLRKMAQELVQIIRKNTTIDWTLKRSVQAHLRILVKGLLKKYDYPPDKQDLATVTVLEQAELLARDWTGEN